MKVIYDDHLFDTIPGLCVGILAVRALDNRGVNLEAEALEIEDLSRIWDHSCLMDHQTGDGRRFLVGQGPTHFPIEIPDRHRTVDIDRSIRSRTDALHGYIVLVLDVADDLFEDILQCDEAHHLAVLVDH